ncbi:MAG: hypothetical protein KY475_16160, partial [Planctomycetes bacterium]|nr:hypothetical protein [Planctomycetota bacterium]
MRTILLAGLTLAITTTALAGKQSPQRDDITQALSGDEQARDAAIERLRERGRAALDELLAMRDALVQRREQARVEPQMWRRLSEGLERLDEVIDRVGGQRYCSASRLYWHTDFAAAQAEAQQSGKPILSLRMLGRLTDEFSCANSRFFRTTLYANEEVSNLLRAKYVLHWQSVRPVPRITIDFGDGRRIERTVTGNSAHYVLTPDGRPVEALPGLYGVAAFRAWLQRAEDLSQTLAAATPADREAVLQTHHARRIELIDESWRFDLSRAGLDASLDPARVTDEADWRQIASLHAEQATLDAASVRLIRSQNPGAGQAMPRAVTKAVVEDPLVRLVANLQSDIALDTVKNEYQLHRRIHEQFVKKAPLTAA